MALQLFSDLRDGAWAVTVNQRLAREVMRRFDLEQQRCGLAVWLTPTVLPWPAFVDTLLEHDPLADRPEAPASAFATDDQMDLLWEQAVAEHSGELDLMRPAAAARQARQAWQLVTDYRIDLDAPVPMPGANADYLQRWAHAVEVALARHGLRNPDRRAWALVEALQQGKGNVPRQLWLVGFRQATPVQLGVWEALVAAGCTLDLVNPPGAALEVAPPTGVRQRDPSCAWPSQTAQVRRVVAPDPESELAAAVNWAQTALEEAPETATIGLVVPNLAERRAEVQRGLERGLRPGRALWGSWPVDLSLGRRLSDFPLIDAALRALELCIAPIEIERLRPLLQSPFFLEAGSEGPARARLDFALRLAGRARVTLLELHRRADERTADGAPLAHSCPALARGLGEVRQALAMAPAEQGPADWARHFDRCLGALGWPWGAAGAADEDLAPDADGAGSGSLSSAEYQTWLAWRALLDRFAGLDDLLRGLGIAEAFARVRRLAVETLFQPQGHGEPIQVLGLFEAEGLVFDQMWVLGLDEGTFPPAAAPNPFIPTALQRTLRLPRADATRELANARAQLAMLARACGRLTLSSPEARGDTRLRASPLITTWPTEAPGVNVPTSAARRYANAVRASALAIGAQVWVTDTSAHRLERITLDGGAALLKDQAACPFRAFARHRLVAEAPPEPDALLDPGQRGGLVHHALDELMERIPSSERLAALTVEQRRRACGEAATRAVDRLARRVPEAFSGAFHELEVQRLGELLVAWLDVEGERGQFRVVEREASALASLAGRTLRTRIDRVDRLGDGCLLIVDYKTGARVSGADQWFGDRPDEPQLPLYALALGEAVAGFAYGLVRPGSPGYYGLARAEIGVAGVRPMTSRAPDLDWSECVATWRATLEALVDEFVAGEARVDPKSGQATCRRCPFGGLCRIREQPRSPLTAHAVQEDTGDDAE